METVELDEGLRRTTAPNGLVVLSETLPGVRSAAVGIYVRTASAHEPRRQLGISHLLEHMVFKGTERRTAQELALGLEIRGGGLDAFTGRDYTSYQAHVLDADLPLAVEILTDLVRRPLLREGDLEPERNVILEEISGVADTPDDLVFELHAETLWPEHPYGYSILGTPESLAPSLGRGSQGPAPGRLLPGKLRDRRGGTREPRSAAHRPRAGRLVRGNRSRVAPCAGDAGSGRSGRLPGRGPRHRPDPHRLRHRYLPAARSPPLPAAILTNVFGGGMSSRLFQRVREELGLAYAIFAYKHFYQGSGQLGVYVGTQPATADRAVDAIRAEYARLAREGLPMTELANGKQQLKGQVMLSLESPAARMGRLAGFILHDDRYRPLDEMLREIDSVTSEEIAAVASEFFAPERQTVVRLGPQKSVNGKR